MCVFAVFIICVYLCSWTKTEYAKKEFRNDVNPIFHVKSSTDLYYVYTFVFRYFEMIFMRSCSALFFIVFLPGRISIRQKQITDNRIRIIVCYVYRVIKEEHLKHSIWSFSRLPWDCCSIQQHKHTGSELCKNIFVIFKSGSAKETKTKFL